MTNVAILCMNIHLLYIPPISNHNVGFVSNNNKQYHRSYIYMVGEYHQLWHHNNNIISNYYNILDFTFITSTPIEISYY